MRGTTNLGNLGSVCVSIERCLGNSFSRSSKWRGNKNKNKNIP